MLRSGAYDAVRDTVRLAALKREHVHREGQECPACIHAERLLNLDDIEFSTLPFCEAAMVWKELRKRQNLRPRTHESDEGFLNALTKFFGEMRLNQITAGSVREYQLARSTNAVSVRVRGADGAWTVDTIHPWHQPAGASLINHEICALGRMLARGRLWAAIKPNYTPMPVARWSPRQVLSEEDEERLFVTAARFPEAALAYWVATITNNTTAAGCELRGLRLENLFLREPVVDERGFNINPSEIYIPPEATKRESRPRKIALNPSARWAIEQCYRRALALGSCQPKHFLFPFRVKKNTYDPMRPPSRWWIRDNWKKLVQYTGLEVKPHDLRHQCITRMLERGVDGETVRAIAGHVTEEMMQYYSHIRRQAKYAAVMAIEPTAAAYLPMAKVLPPKRPALSVEGYQAKARRA